MGRRRGGERPDNEQERYCQRKTLDDLFLFSSVQPITCRPLTCICVRLGGIVAGSSSRGYGVEYTHGPMWDTGTDRDTTTVGRYIPRRRGPSNSRTPQPRTEISLLLYNRAGNTSLLAPAKDQQLGIALTIAEVECGASSGLSIATAKAREAAQLMVVTNWYEQLVVSSSWTAFFPRNARTTRCDLRSSTELVCGSSTTCNLPSIGDLRGAWGCLSVDGLHGAVRSPKTGC